MRRHYHLNIVLPHVLYFKQHLVNQTHLYFAGENRKYIFLFVAFSQRLRY